MIRSLRGFTIVEVLIVISVMGILLSIGVVGWNNLTSASRDDVREADLKQWGRALDLYKSRFSSWPILPANDADTTKWVCLGKLGSTSVTNPDRCVQFNGTLQYTGATGTYLSTTIGTQGTNYSTLATQMQRIGNMPTNTAPDAKNSYRGPFAYFSRTSVGVSPNITVTVTGRFVNFFEKSCPSETSRILPTSTSPVVLYPSPYSPLLTGVPVDIYVCETQKQFIYTTS